MACPGCGLRFQRQGGAPLFSPARRWSPADQALQQQDCSHHRWRGERRDFQGLRENGRSDKEAQRSRGASRGAPVREGSAAPG